MEQFVADVAWQVEAVIISQAVGAVAGGNQYVSMAVYATLNILKGLVDKAEQDNIIRSKRLLDESYRKTKTLSRKWVIDDYFGDMMTSALIGRPFGIYAPVQIMTNDYEYKGEVVLAPVSKSIIQAS